MRFYRQGRAILQLTEGQKAAAQKIHEAVFRHEPSAFLLRGVAASGKTEIYLSAIKDALDQGKSVLYLVPEIGLCVQSAEILKERFGDKNVCVYHSDISPKERFENWWKIKRGEWPIVVGARSAALLPAPDLGVIIVDEEQDRAYKEDRKPRFHVRDVAFERARQNNAAVIFGTASPSLELFQEMREGRVELLELEERVVQASAPQVRIIDVRTEKKYGSLAPSLLTAIGERLKKNEQTILFLNRRGFHRTLRCSNCEWVARCEKCGVTLVQHKRTNDQASKHLEASTLRCHTCSNSCPPPVSCPECHHKKLTSGGTGTQRVEEEIKEKFPWVKVARWDRDSAKKRGAQERIFQEFREGDIDVLVGTQIVAQGFNFPKVTLVGVVDADAPLYIPDFRAAEHAYQLLTQVAGRAGRELVTGEVLVQTRQPDHYAIKFASHMDFSGFAEEELRFRQDLNYPPFSNLIQIQTTSQQAAKAQADMQKLVEWVSALNLAEPIGILGPTASRRKKRGVTRFQVLLKVPNAAFREFLDVFGIFYEENFNRFSVDVNPV